MDQISDLKAYAASSTWVDNLRKLGFNELSLKGVYSEPVKETVLFSPAKDFTSEIKLSHPIVPGTFTLKGKLRDEPISFFDAGNGYLHCDSVRINSDDIVGCINYDLGLASLSDVMTPKSCDAEYHRNDLTGYGLIGNLMTVIIVPKPKETVLAIRITVGYGGYNAQNTFDWPRRWFNNAEKACGGCLWVFGIQNYEVMRLLAPVVKADIARNPYKLHAAAHLAYMWRAPQP